MSIFRTNNPGELFRSPARSSMKAWASLEGSANSTYTDMLYNQAHLLIAGTTGSGKSVLINGLIHTALSCRPTLTSFVLIDPKRVELVAYKNLPHTIAYASEPEDIVATLQDVVRAMDMRYKIMAKYGQKKSTFNHIFVVIDEFADLITTNKKQVQPLLCRIAQLGRAAKIHLIVATQRPTRDIITGQIKVNIDARVALRCPTAQDSRNIINVSGAELLPRYGQGYYITPESNEPTLYNLPYTEEEDIQARIKFWQDEWKHHKRFRATYFVG